MAPKVQMTKEEANWTESKLKHFVLQKTPLRK